MILPTRLSEPALAILRVFVRAEARNAGDTLPRASVLDESKLPAASFDEALRELVAAGLVEPATEEGAPLTLSATGGAFFAKYYRTCH